ncbi:hypothetical protein C0J52_02113 [Blattella germanica]|nr:hypothetical protein C0J52_02113 [Blattella germanica]
MDYVLRIGIVVILIVLAIVGNLVVLVGLWPLCQSRSSFPVPGFSRTPSPVLDRLLGSATISSLLLALLTGVAQLPVLAFDWCPPEVWGVHGQCYSQNIASNFSWLDASMACEERGGTLAGFPSGRYPYHLPNLGPMIVVPGFCQVQGLITSFLSPLVICYLTLISIERGVQVPGTPSGSPLYLWTSVTPNMDFFASCVEFFETLWLNIVVMLFVLWNRNRYEQFLVEYEIDDTDSSEDTADVDESGDMDRNQLVAFVEADSDSREEVPYGLSVEDLPSLQESFDGEVPVDSDSEDDFNPVLGYRAWDSDDFSNGLQEYSSVDSDYDNPEQQLSAMFSDYANLEGQEEFADALDYANLELLEDFSETLGYANPEEEEEQWDSIV